MNPYLLKLLKDWYQWATNGAPKHHYLTSDSGLCFFMATGSPYHQWLLRGLPESQQKDLTRSFWVGGVQLNDLLRQEFGFSGHTYPFSKDAYHFRLECRTESTHMNPKRLEWVRKMLVQHGELVE